MSIIFNNTKIVCTIGPASESRGVLKDLIKSGMRVARLNFSHGSYKHHKLLIDNIRQVSRELNIPCAILQDLQGPKIRVGDLAKPVELSKEDKVMLVMQHKIEELLREQDELGKIIPLQYNLANQVGKGDTLLIDDGLVGLQVTKNDGETIWAKVKSGGPVGSHKGINVPGKEIKAKVITKKDKEDLKFGLSQGVDIIALSFVESGKNIKQLKKLINKYLPKSEKIPPLVVAKIEREIAVRNLDNILPEVDALMVARGDLGLEIPASEVPIAQKEIISKCLKNYKTVIVATQMLDSMIRNPRPTRAEATDVSTAVVDHADALMLSGESAFGKYPVLACKTMAEIIKNTEKSPYDNIEVPLKKGAGEEEALAHAAWSLSIEVGARAIVVTTISGKTARIISRFRPELPIVAVCESERVQRQMAFSWGVFPFVLREFSSVDQLIEESVKQVKRAGLAFKGDKLVLVSGQPVGKGGANLIKIHQV